MGRHRVSPPSPRQPHITVVNGAMRRAFKGIVPRRDAYKLNATWAPKQR